MKNLNSIKKIKGKSKEGRLCSYRYEWHLMKTNDCLIIDEPRRHAGALISLENYEKKHGASFEATKVGRYLKIYKII